MQPDIQHHFAAGLYAKEYFLPKGWAVPQHIHPYSHLSLLAKGTVYVDVDGVQTKYEAPACIEIKANTSHVIITETDTIWYCIHALSEAEKFELDNELITDGDPYGRLG
jgi:quercetin dioxygenase-like cupin family protein